MAPLKSGNGDGAIGGAGIRGEIRLIITPYMPQRAYLVDACPWGPERGGKELEPDLGCFPTRVIYSLLHYRESLDVSVFSGLGPPGYACIYEP